MEKLLTIVIPSYNVEQTLRQAVESLLIPNEELRSSLDVLIVNDGSKDGTLTLAKQLEVESPSIVRVWNKENGGHGSTINVGIDQAYGKYMKVLDGDDWLETDALQEYLHVLAETDADIVATDYYKFFIKSNKKQVIKISTIPYGQVVCFEDIWDKYTFNMPSMAIKTSRLRNQKRRIEEHCYYVDTELDVLAAINAETVLYVDKKLYVYRVEQGEQSVSVQGKMKHYLEHEQVCYTLLEWLKNLRNDATSKVRVLFLEKMTTISFSAHYFLGMGFPPKDKKRYLMHLKDFDAKLRKSDKSIYDLLSKRTNFKCRQELIKLLRASKFSAASYEFIRVIIDKKQDIKKVFSR